MRLLRPDGSTALHDVWSPTGAWHGQWENYLSYRVNFNLVGKWKVEIWHAKLVAKAPIRVVARQGSRSATAGRIGSPTLTLLPIDPPQCRLTTSLVTEDPDYDIVSYRYRWTVDGRAVRTVTSAALSDVLRRGVATPGSRLACSVHAFRREAVGADSYGKR